MQLKSCFECPAENQLHNDTDSQITNGKQKVDFYRVFATLTPELGLVPNSYCVTLTLRLNIAQFQTLTLTTVLQFLVKETT